jgi:acetyl-CoA carboxylase biotin carboxylase subunit
MYEAALALVKHIGYTNAGTIEFLLDREGNFYFMEMNTRLQVEHPVTEMITGLDMVEMQIRVAAGEPLSVSQKDIEREGHAIEARIYPEDPYTLLPVSGRIEYLELPRHKHIRIDSALFPGYEINPHYDSLMAKVCAWGKSRKIAIDTLDKGLQVLHLEGITHNIPLIRWVLEDEEFRKGNFSTASLPKIIQQKQNPTSELSEQEQVAAVTTALGTLFGAGPATQRASSPWKGYGRMSQMSFRSRGGQW